MKSLQAVARSSYSVNIAALTFEEVTWRFPAYASWGFKEKAPSLYLSQYLDWVHNYYTIDQKTMEVSRREVPLDQMGAPGMEASASDQVIPARSAHKSVKKKPPNPPLPVSCRKCTDFSFWGTNAYVQVKTCKDCGKVEKTKKEMPEKKDIYSCEHKNTNRLGSNKATMRVFCKDCGNFIDEMPREEAKRRQATGRDHVSSILRPGIEHSAICESGCGANYRAGSGDLG